MELEEKITSMQGDLKVIDQKLDTLIDFNKDHELRVRALEQRTCPFHQTVEKRLDNLDINSAVSNTKIMIIVGVGSFLGAGITTIILSTLSRNVFLPIFELFF